MIVTDAASDDEFDYVPDFDMSEPESDPDADIDADAENPEHDTPSTTPPRPQTPRTTDQKTIKCPYPECLKSFNRNARLQEHLRSHTNTRLFKCPFPGCKKDFLRDSHLKHHVKSAHTDIRDYKCNWEGCDKSFATGTRLRRHLQAHEGKEKFRCRGFQGCNETFRKHDTLKKHVATVHERMKAFSCEFVDSNGRACSQAFDTANKLRAHQRAKHDNTRFSCTECLSHGSTNNSDTEQDVNQEGDFKEVAPNERSAYFATFADLQAHITAVHPPTCHLCPTSFTTSKEVTRHLELQHGIISNKYRKSFACTSPGCDRTFTKKGNLNVHVKTVHQKQKEFVCGATEILVPAEMATLCNIEVYGCGRSFTSKATLEEHVRTAHLGLPSRRSERERKRKAEKDEDGDQGSEPKIRRPRRDKDVKKTSALATITGYSAYQPTESFPQHQVSDDVSLPYQTRPLQESQQHNAQYGEDGSQNGENDDNDDDNDNDDWNMMSGSMTLMDGHVYHYDKVYKYESGDSSHHSQITESHYIPCRSSKTADDDDDTEMQTEPFFDFEHEPELLGKDLMIDPIDPALIGR